jgi:hypothetical protein
VNRKDRRGESELEEVTKHNALSGTVFPLPTGPCQLAAEFYFYTAGPKLFQARAELAATSSSASFAANSAPRLPDVPEKPDQLPMQSGASTVLKTSRCEQ